MHSTGSSCCQMLEACLIYPWQILEFISFCFAFGVVIGLGVKWGPSIGGNTHGFSLPDAGLVPLHLFAACLTNCVESYLRNGRAGSC